MVIIIIKELRGRIDKKTASNTGKNQEKLHYSYFLEVNIKCIITLEIS